LTVYEWRNLREGSCSDHAVSYHIHTTGCLKTKQLVLALAKVSADSVDRWWSTAIIGSLQSVHVSDLVYSFDRSLNLVGELGVFGSLVQLSSP